MVFGGPFWPRPFCDSVKGGSGIGGAEGKRCWSKRVAGGGTTPRRNRLGNPRPRPAGRKHMSLLLLSSGSAMGSSAGSGLQQTLPSPEGRVPVGRL